MTRFQHLCSLSRLGAKSGLDMFILAWHKGQAVQVYLQSRSLVSSHA